jgi:hypothetical protein
LDRCIYCGTTENAGKPFQNEHGIPQLLRGHYEILNSSCSACAKSTSEIERKCSEQIFERLSFRLKLAEQKIYRNIKLNFYPGVTPKRISLPIDKAPFALSMPVFSPLGFLAGNESDNWSKLGMWTIQDKNFKNIGLPAGWKRYEYKYKYPLREFVRMIAKIAHCEAVADLGYGNFKPFLPNLIRGTDNSKLPYFVGGAPIELPPTKLRHHRIAFKFFTNATSKQQIVCVNVQLFAELGTPQYFVVVGEVQEDVVESYLRVRFESHVTRASLRTRIMTEAA